jgi:hypothetical protein
MFQQLIKFRDDPTKHDMMFFAPGTVERRVLYDLCTQWGLINHYNERNLRFNIEKPSQGFSSQLSTHNLPQDWTANETRTPYASSDVPYSASHDVAQFGMPVRPPIVSQYDSQPASSNSSSMFSRPGFVPSTSAVSSPFSFDPQAAPGSSNSDSIHGDWYMCYRAPPLDTPRESLRDDGGSLRHTHSDVSSIKSGSSASQQSYRGHQGRKSWSRRSSFVDQNPSPSSLGIHRSTSASSKGSIGCRINRLSEAGRAAMKALIPVGGACLKCRISRKKVKV